MRHRKGFAILVLAVALLGGFASARAEDRVIKVGTLKLTSHLAARAA